jgi:hypothetical protein
MEPTVDLVADLYAQDDDGLGPRPHLLHRGLAGRARKIAAQRKFVGTMMPADFRQAVNFRAPGGSPGAARPV